MQEWSTPAAKTTRDIRVQAEAKFLPERSVPNSEVYFFVYRITVENLSSESAQLTRRHWRITDAFGRIEEVEGEGVVGETPIILPQESFSYISACPLPTNFGSMEGSYSMVGPADEDYAIEIPQFQLISPEAIH